MANLVRQIPNSLFDSKLSYRYSPKPEHFVPVIEWWNNRRALNVDGFDKARCYTVQELTGELGYNLDQCGYPHEEEEILAPMDLIQRYQEERASLNAEIDRVLNQIQTLLNTDKEN